jgi:hypothetical protein
MWAIILVFLEVLTRNMWTDALFSDTLWAAEVTYSRRNWENNRWIGTEKNRRNLF